MKVAVAAIIIAFTQTLGAAQLSEPAVKLLLAGDSGFVTYLDKDWEQQDSDAPAVRELRDKGLAAVTPLRGRQYAYEVNLTDAGTDAYDSCIRSLRAKSADLTEGALKALFTFRFNLMLLDETWETTSRYARAVRELRGKGLLVVAKSDHPRYPYKATLTSAGTKRYAAGIRSLRTVAISAMESIARDGSGPRDPSAA